MTAILKRAAIVAALTVTSLAVAIVPSSAAVAPRLSVNDRPGAPAAMLQQLERLAGQPLGDLEKVVAVDADGRRLSIDQLEALVAGEDVDGVKVLGTMAGSRELLETTLADLADGEFDGRDGGATTSTVMFATRIPEGREWCLTMCIASGKSVYECILARMGSAGWLNVDVPGSTRLGATKVAFERASGMSLGTLASTETLVGEGEPSEQDIRDLAAGKDVGSLRRVATVERPDLDWELGDVAGNSGVVYAKTVAHIFTFELPLLGKFLASCISQDGGKTWKCTLRPWGGF